MDAAPAGPVPVDVVGSEPRTASRRTRLVVAGLALLAVAGLAGDRWQRERSLDALVAAVSEAEQVVVASQRSQSGLADYSASALSSPDGAVRAAAYDNLARDAVRWLPRLAGPQQRLQQTRVLPWHDDLLAARAAYDRRLEQWVDVLERSREVPALALDRPPEVAASRDDARTALSAVGIGVLG